MFKRMPTVIVVVVVCVALFFYFCAYQVRFTETAVVTRFERPVARQVEQGLNFKWPWPIEQVHRYDSRLRAFETDFTQLSTEDQKTLTVSAFATWAVTDARKFLKAVGPAENAQRKIEDLLKNAVSRVLKRHPLDDLINVDPKKIKYREIEDEIVKAVANDARDSYGITVSAIGIKRLGLPEKNVDAVAERMKAERKAVSDKLLAEGDAEYARIIANASIVADKIKSRAEGYAKTIEGQGEAQAAKNYEVFKRNADLASFLKMNESLENISQSGEGYFILDARRIEPFKALMPAEEEKSPHKEVGQKKSDVPQERAENH